MKGTSLGRVNDLPVIGSDVIIREDDRCYLDAGPVEGQGWYVVVNGAWQKAPHAGTGFSDVRGIEPDVDNQTPSNERQR